MGFGHHHGGPHGYAGNAVCAVACGQERLRWPAVDDVADSYRVNTGVRPILQSVVVDVDKHFAADCGASKFGKVIINRAGNGHRERQGTVADATWHVASAGSAAGALGVVRIGVARWLHLGEDACCAHWHRSKAVGAVSATGGDWPCREQRRGTSNAHRSGQARVDRVAIVHRVGGRAAFAVDAAGHRYLQILGEVVVRGCAARHNHDLSDAVFGGHVTTRYACVVQTIDVTRRLGFDHRVFTGGQVSKRVGAVGIGRFAD